MKYKLKGKRGVDDLLGVYAFVGNSQGDHSCSNDLDVYHASKGWMSYMFDVPMTKEDIDAEVLRRKLANSVYIEELYSKNIFGEEYETSIEFEESTLDSSHNIPPMESHSFYLLDYCKEN